ncbi:AzlD domain-containing protein [Streptococcus caprae]|uniref:AzlD domain-containing protein n=1 Tax=Streptococcus caprae TaxID=1640501 RepID=A0ABV8CVM1_9STRE
MISTYVFGAIVLSALVTWVPRVLPFVLTRYKALPDLVVRFLSFLPLTIIFALTLSSVVSPKVGQLPKFLPIETIAVLPTFFLAAKTKNILLAVVVGVVLVAGLRFIF